MNSLEFIEKEINKIKLVLDKKTRELHQLPKEEKWFKKAYKKIVEKLKEELNTLEQIKTELEAWEVVKKHLEYFPDDYWNGITEEIITMTSQIDKKDYPTIKKALEVQDEDRK